MARRLRLGLHRLDDRLVPTTLVPLPPGGSAVLAELTLASDTALDPRYGTVGEVHIPVARGETHSPTPNLQTVRLSDGRTLTVAYRGGQVVVERRLADGSPDRAFAGDGRVELAGGRAAGVAARPDGGAVVAIGSNDFRNDPPGTIRPAVAPGLFVVRLTATGAVDEGYGRRAGEPFSQAFAGVTGYPTAVAAAADGRVAVTYETGGETSSLGLVVLAADGTRQYQREYTAADLGMAIQSAAPPAPAVGLVPSAVSFAPGGGLAVAATRTVNFRAGVTELSRNGFVLKLTAAGERDAGFSQDGLLGGLPGGVPTTAETATELAVLADGRVVVGGTLGESRLATWYVSRFRPDGTRDTTLGSGEPPPGTLFVEGPTGAFGAGTLLDFTLLADDRVVVLADRDVSPNSPNADVVPVHEYDLAVAGPAGTDGPVTPLRFDQRPPRAVTADAGGGVLVGLAESAGYALVRPLAVAGLTVGPLPGRVIVDPPPDPRATYTLATDGPRVTVTRSVEGVATALPTLTPFEASYTGTLNAVLADLTGDGVPELVVAPEMGGGPVVVVYSLAGTELARFYGIEDANFRGGARVAAGDLDGDGAADVIVTAGPGGGPRVAVFDGRRVAGDRRKLVGDFFAFEEGQRGGANVAAGDLDADGRAELVFGAGVGGGPRVTVLDGRDLLAGKQTVRFDDFVGDPAGRDGARVRVRTTTNGGSEHVNAEAAVGRDPAVPFRGVYESVKVSAGPQLPEDGTPVV